MTSRDAADRTGLPVQTIEREASRYDDGMIGNPLLLRNRGAARAAGVPYSTWRSLVRRGIAPRPVYLGRTPYWSVTTLERWVAAGCPPAELTRANAGEARGRNR